MSITTTNLNKYAGKFSCFQVQPVEKEVMGFKLADTYLAEGDEIPMGTPILASDASKTANICKYAVIESKTSATKFVLKDVKFLKVGDKIYKSGQENPTLSTISAIDTATREITLAADNSQFAAGDIVLEGKSETVGSGSSAVTTIVPVRVPNYVTGRYERYTSHNKTVNGAFRCVAIQNILHYPAEYLNAETFPGSTLLVGNPAIRFITQ